MLVALLMGMLMVGPFLADADPLGWPYVDWAYLGLAYRVLSFSLIRNRRVAS